MQRPTLEVRLESGYRMWWSTITPIVAGQLKVLSVSEVFRDIDLLWSPVREMGGNWDLWPIDNPARPHPLTEVDRLIRPVQLTLRTLGIALVSLHYEDDGKTRWLWLELFLSEIEPAQDGRSLCQDWVHILRAAKDDERQEAVLKLNFADLSPEEIADFKSGKKLVTSDLALEVQDRV